MEQHEEHLKNLSEIRSLMERSTRFISLSGLSGIFAGVFALAGAAIAFHLLDINPFVTGSYFVDTGRTTVSKIMMTNWETIKILFLVAVLVLIGSVAAGYFFTVRNARKKNQNIWGQSSMQMLLSLIVPLVTGGIFCLVLVHHYEFGLVAPATLIFYGLALMSAGKHTLKEVNYLGFSEIMLGLVAAFYINYGLFFWAIGFGVLHIVYGAVMYFRYER